MAKKVVSRFSQSMTVEQEMLLIFNAIVTEFTNTQIERRLRGSITP